MIGTFFGETVTRYRFTYKNDFNSIELDEVKTKAVLFDIYNYVKLSQVEAEQIVQAKKCCVQTVYVVFNNLCCLPDDVSILKYMVNNGVEVLMPLTTENYEKAPDIVKFIVTTKRDNPCIPFIPFMVALQNNRIFGVHKGIQVTFGLNDMLELLNSWHDSVKLRID